MSDTSTGSERSMWSRFTRLFHSQSSSRRTSQASSTASRSSTSSRHNSLNKVQHGRRLKELEINQDLTPVAIPPYSPTYCKKNEFPYSNFYVKLPDGNWMVRYRSGNRDILRTDIISGDLI